MRLGLCADERSLFGTCGGYELIPFSVCPGVVQRQPSSFSWNLRDSVGRAKESFGLFCGGNVSEMEHTLCLQ